MLSRINPFLLLTVLGLLFFADLLLHPTQMLYSDTSDLVALHLPDKHFLVHSYKETGEIPLWCPYRFAGVPFVHDIQVAAFYPLHGPLYLLPESWLGAAMSWLVVLHVILAGWCMYLYARHQELSRLGALVAAIGYMFAGKWLLHILLGGHYNMIMLCWLPLVLLLLEQALERAGNGRLLGALFHAAWAGAVFALIILGAYPYVTLYAGLLVALWTLTPAVEQAGYLGGKGPRSWRRTAAALGRWLGLGAWTAAAALALGAVQLWPGIEAAGLATRAGGVSAHTMLNLGVAPLMGLAGPTVLGDAPNRRWEFIAGFGVAWLGLACLAPVLRRGRVRFQAGLCVFFLFLACGGIALFTWLPGFGLFRLPTRIFLVAALPMALLAGITTQALFDDPAPDAETLRRCRRVLLWAVGGVLFLAGSFATVFAMRHYQLRFDFYWLTLLLTVPALFVLLGDRTSLTRNQREILWCLLLLLDLWALTRPVVAVRPEEEIYAPSESVTYLMQHRDRHGRVLDRDQEPQHSGNTPLGTGAPLALVDGIEGLRGFNPVDVVRYKEYLQFVTDHDEPLEPLSGPLTSPLMTDFPIRNKRFLDLLGTTYLLQPSAQPVESEEWQPKAVDPHPRAFDVDGGGLQDLPAYTVYENQRVLPRVFVVPEADRLPDERQQILPALKATALDRRVLLEDFTPSSGSAAPAGEPRGANLVEYQPNRVVVEIPDPDGSAGYLVLTDIWYPGWTCTVDGEPAKLYRADYLFRGVAVPAGKHRVVFTFEPASYRYGKMISEGALVLLLLGTLAAGVLQLRNLGVVERARDTTPRTNNPASA